MTDLPGLLTVLHAAHSAVFAARTAANLAHDLRLSSRCAIAAEALTDLVAVLTETEGHNDHRSSERTEGHNDHRCSETEGKNNDKVALFSAKNNAKVAPREKIPSMLTPKTREPTCT